MFEAFVLAFYCFLVIGTAVLFLKFRERVRLRRDQLAYETLKRDHPERVYGTPEYAARFTQPDFAAIEAHLGRPAPNEYRKLYHDIQTIQSTNIEITPPETHSPDDRWPIVCFFPADQQGVTDLWPGQLLSPSQLPFATDGSGGLYYLELEGQNTDDPPVFFYHWDGELRAQISDALSTFLSWQRHTVPDSDPGRASH